jgi:hypothetical protein
LQIVAVGRSVLWKASAWKNTYLTRYSCVAISFEVTYAPQLSLASRPSHAVNILQITGAALLEAMSRRSESAPALTQLVPSILSLLSELEPPWAGLCMARTSAALALSRFLHAWTAPTIALKYPGLQEAAMAPLMCQDSATVLLKNFKRGQNELKSASASCLSRAVECPGWKAAFLGEEGLKVSIPVLARFLFVLLGNAFGQNGRD